MHVAYTILASGRWYCYRKVTAGMMSFWPCGSYHTV